MESSIERDGTLGYRTKVLGNTFALAYTDDLVLVSSTREGFQKLINASQQFFEIASIKLNPKKCEVIKINGSPNDEQIKIDATEVQYTKKADYIKYLGVPLGGKRIGAFKYGEKIV
jgi:hypothetical protein